MSLKKLKPAFNSYNKKRFIKNKKSHGNALSIVSRKISRQGKKMENCTNIWIYVLSTCINYL